MTPHVRLHIQLEPQLGADLQRAAHELGVSTSELIRRGARKVVDEHQLGRGAVMPAASARPWCRLRRGLQPPTEKIDGKA
jgi:hypothetical protein